MEPQSAASADEISLLARERVPEPLAAEMLEAVAYREAHRAVSREPRSAGNRGGIVIGRPVARARPGLIRAAAAGTGGGDTVEAPERLAALRQHGLLDRAGFAAAKSVPLSG